MNAPEMKIELWDVDRLIPYEKNSKKHDKAQVKGIVASIKATGWDQPIVVDRNGVIIKGHGRRLAAIELGMTKVPVLVRADLTDAQVKAARLNDNRAALGGIDAALMRDELAELLADNGLDLLDGVFESKELDFGALDLGTMNTDAFIDDIDVAVRAQAEKANEVAEESAGRRIPLAKVFGFKDIAGGAELAVNRFMAAIEAATGLTGEAAFTKHMHTVAGSAA